MDGWIFDSKDLDLLQKVLFLHPDLAMVAYAGKLARERLQYPIKEHSQLLPLFDANGQSEFYGHTVSYEQAKQFMPKEFFPIENEEQFLSRVFLAFEIQRQFPMKVETTTFVDPSFNFPPTSYSVPM